MGEYGYNGESGSALRRSLMSLKAAFSFLYDGGEQTQESASALCVYVCGWVCLCVENGFFKLVSLPYVCIHSGVRKQRLSTHL